MELRGIIRKAELHEWPPGSDAVEMLLGVQGVGPGQPRHLVVPFERLLEDPTLDPDTVTGRGFAAEVAQDEEGRWVVASLSLASRVLRGDG